MNVEGRKKQQQQQTNKKGKKESHVVTKKIHKDRNFYFFLFNMNINFLS